MPEKGKIAPKAPTDVATSEDSEADEAPPFTAEMFISHADRPLTLEEKKENIERLLKMMSLPPLDEINRLELEAAARQSRGSGKAED